jgi:hypothetical protein
LKVEEDGQALRGWSLRSTMFQPLVRLRCEILLLP